MRSYLLSFLLLCIPCYSHADDWPPRSLSGYWTVTSSSEDEIFGSSQGHIVLITGDLLVYVRPEGRHLDWLVWDTKRETFVERSERLPPEIWAARLARTRLIGDTYRAFSKERLRTTGKSEPVRFEIGLQTSDSSSKERLRISHEIAVKSLTMDGWLLAERADQQDAKMLLETLMQRTDVDCTPELRAILEK